MESKGISAVVTAVTILGTQRVAKKISPKDSWIKSLAITTIGLVVGHAASECFLRSSLKEKIKSKAKETLVDTNSEM